MTTSARSLSLLALICATVATTLMTPRPAHAAGDIKRGADVFDSQCAECHSVRQGKNKKGPSLFASVGRAAGTVPDFVYSDALKQSGITWTPDKIQTYLAGPKKMVPGGKMKYDSDMTPTDVTDLLAYLGSLH
jgi:cytochrome c